jgi:hypothetical protein
MKMARCFLFMLTHKKSVNMVFGTEGWGFESLRVY